MPQQAKRCKDNGLRIYECPLFTLCHVKTQVLQIQKPMALVKLSFINARFDLMGFWGFGVLEVAKFHQITLT